MSKMGGQGKGGVFKDSRSNMGRPRGYYTKGNNSD